MADYSQGAETLVSDEWLSDTLTNDTGPGGLFDLGLTGVWESAAPPNTPYPFCVWQALTPVDINGVGPGARIMSSVQYIVKFTTADLDNFLLLKPFVRRLDYLLNGQQAMLPDGAVLGCRRDEEYRQTEQDSGSVIRHLGGLYTAWVQSF